MTLRRLVPAAALALAVAVLSGCTSSTVRAQPTTALPTAPLFSDTPTPVSTVVPPAASPSAVADLGSLGRARTASWPTLRDAASGVSFRLPKVVRGADKVTNGIPQRLYTVPVSSTTGVSVAVLQAGSAANVQNLLTAYLDGIAAQFQSEGLPDAAVLDRATFRVGALPAVRGRIFFTPKTAPAIPPVWFVQAVADGRFLVVAQTVTFPLTRSAAYLPAARALQARLLGGLQFS